MQIYIYLYISIQKPGLGPEVIKFENKIESCNNI